jgi:HAD superfamily hydrolase (TIGR01459 family)
MTSPRIASAATPRILSGIAGIAERYDAFILDLWGVIHDGEKPYRGALRCLAELKARGKATVLLSNAPRRADVIHRQLAGFGVARELYGDLVSSGEEVHRLLAARDDAWFAALGRKCFHLGAARDDSVWESLDLDMVHELAAASFILDTGPWDDAATVGQYETLLKDASGIGLPMICANPDRVVVRGGALVLCAGALALRYEELGGNVRWIGKPHPEVYRRCFEILGVTDPRKVLAVGDSLVTDIAGAAGLGMDSVFVTGGLHAAEQGIAPETVPDPARLAMIYRDAGLAPTAAMPLFAW